MKEEIQDKIDNYLLGRMPIEDRLTFEKEVETDSELKEQLEYTERLKQALKSRSEKLVLMNEWKKDYERQYDKEISQTADTGSGYEYSPATSTDKSATINKPSGIKTLYWVAGIAAMFIAGFFILNKPNMGNDNWSNITFPTVNDEFRGSLDYSDIKLLIEQKKYNDALAHIDEELKQLDKDLYQVSIKELRDELMWLKVQTLVGLKRRRDAISTLDKLRNTDGIYRDAAESIYKQIK